MEIISEVDGVTVKGEMLHHDYAKLSVEITHPYQGYCTSRWHPYLAKFQPLRFREKISIDSEVNLKRGTQLLVGIYVTVHHIFGNCEELTKKYKEHMATLDGRKDRYLQIKADRKVLRRQLKDGHINQKDFQPKFGKLQKELQELQSLIHLKNHDFIRLYLPDSAYPLSGEALDILDVEPYSWD